MGEATPQQAEQATKFCVITMDIYYVQGLLLEESEGGCGEEGSLGFDNEDALRCARHPGWEVSGQGYQY